MAVTFRQSITELVSQLKTLFANKTTKSNATSQATAKPNTVFYTTDTKEIIVGGESYGMSSADKSKLDGLATVATSGSYNDLSNKPTIPTVNNSTITVQMNGSTVDSFTTNASSAKTINLGTVITSHQDISGKANLASPTFTGTPSAPTATRGTSTTQIATTAFVMDAMPTNAEIDTMFTSLGLISAS